MASKRTLMPLVVIVVGFLLVSFGLASMFVGGYMVNGEAHHNLNEGIPTLVFGSACVIAGVVAIVLGVRRRRFVRLSFRSSSSR